MDIEKILEALRCDKIIAIFSGFAGWFMPGALFLFHYHKALVIEVDVVKFSLLSITFSTPFLLANVMPAIFLLPRGKEDEEYYKTMVGCACLLAAATSFFYIALAYLFSFGLMYFLISSIILHTVFFIVTALAGSKNKPKDTQTKED